MKTALLFSILAILLLPASVHAYIPPGERMVEQWTAAYERSRNVTITGHYEEAGDKVSFQVEGSRNQVSIMEGGNPTQDATSLLVWGALLRPSSLTRQWHQAGHLDLERTGLARHGDRIAWTLGVEGEQREGTQVWLDRQRQTPFLLIPPPELYTARRISFEGYEASDNRAFPTQIKVTGTGGFERTYTIETISVRR